MYDGICIRSFILSLYRLDFGQNCLLSGIEECSNGNWYKHTPDFRWNV